MFELKGVNLVYDLGKEEVTHALRNMTFKCDDTGLLGLIPLVPLLGHASWHAYRALVDASAWPARD